MKWSMISKRWTVDGVPQHLKSRYFKTPDLPASIQAGLKSISVSSPDDFQTRSSGDDSNIEFKSGDLNHRYKGGIILLIFLLFSIDITYAHEIRPAYLEIKQTDSTAYEVLWKIPLLGNKAPRIDPILPKNFTLKQTSDQFLLDAYIRKYEGVYSESLNGQKIAIQGLDATLVDVLVQINLLDESSYTLLLQPDNSQAMIPKEPSKWEVLQLYIVLGIEHILIGIDHLLFVLGLLLLVKGIRSLIQTVTAFTVAHSITLGAATFDLLTVPQAPVEAVIALSIVFLAREYINQKEGKKSLTAQHPWIVAFTFGLLHGFGFAGALSDIGFPQKEVPLALLTFNIGVELGQLIFIGVVLLFWQLLQKINLPYPKWAWKVLPYGMGIMASFWLMERVVAFW
ncbi:MAG: HupE/UreJ family protein [Bacteroidota bacterium]